jgi:hypothetical protein
VDLSPDDFAFIKALLAYHPKAQQKLEGLEAVYVDFHPNVKFDTRCFFVRRGDGSCEDFSYVRCVDNLPS